MSLLGKKFNAPVAGPMGPFYAAGVVVFYGVWKVQSALMDTPQWKNDPRNPNLKSAKPAEH
ncbi:atp18 subunit J of the mitochondrial F1F0 ATP synthase [Xanthoria parietina]